MTTTERRGRCPECGWRFDPPVSQCPICAVGLLFPEPPMTNDEWVKERAADVYETVMDSSATRGSRKAAIAAFGQEAIARTREEERANAAKALKLAHAMQDKAVAAERKRTLDAVIQAFEKGRRDAFARLENPDEAVVELVADEIFDGEDRHETALDICRALAAILTEKESK